MNKRSKDLWIVVVGDTFYPSIFHFENEEEATEHFKRIKEEKYYDFIHIAKVKDTLIDSEESGERREHLSSISLDEWDIDW